MYLKCRTLSYNRRNFLIVWHCIHRRNIRCQVQKRMHHKVNMSVEIQYIRQSTIQCNKWSVALGGVPDKASIIENVIWRFLVTSYSREATIYISTLSASYAIFLICSYLPTAGILPVQRVSVVVVFLPVPKTVQCYEMLFLNVLQLWFMIGWCMQPRAAVQYHKVHYHNSISLCN